MMDTRERYLTIATIFISVATVALASLRASVPLLDYPFLFPDSYDWLINGLEYSGTLPQRGEISHRSMLLTLMLALLYRIGHIQFATIIGTISLGILSLLLLSFLTQLISRRVALWASLLTFLSFTSLGQSAYVGADSLANVCVSTFALLLLMLVLKPQARTLYLAAFVGGLGAHSQNIFPILTPLFAITIFWGICYNSQLRRLLLSRHTIPALMLCLSIVAFFFIPRILAYSTLYEERVQQASLIVLSTKATKYYLSAFVASFSWPICLLACFGAVAGWYHEKERRVHIAILCCWILNVFIFFAWLYSWRDVRFWIYASVPTFTLAAIGLARLSSLRVRVVYPCMIVLACYAAHSPPTNDPWDRTVMLTPTRSINFLGNGVYSVQRQPSRPYITQHVEDIAVAKRLSESGTASGMRDPELQKTLELSMGIVGGSPVGIFSEVNSDWHYIAKNRNRLYARSNAVQLLPSIPDVTSFLASNRFIICQRDELQRVLTGAQTAASQYREIALSSPNLAYILIDFGATN